MIRWYELDKASNKADAYFVTIHIVIPSSRQGKSQSGERYLNHVYELCNLLQFKHDVSYISVALIMMFMLLKCYLHPTQRHLVTFTPPTEIIFRVGLNAVSELFSHWFQISQWNNHHGSLGYYFSHALSQSKKGVSNIKQYVWQYPMYPQLRCSF